MNITPGRLAAHSFVAPAASRVVVIAAVLPIAFVWPLARPAAAQAGAPAGQAARAPISYPNAFVRHVFEQFDAWDADHDGVLTEKELDIQIRSPQVKGEDAATVATLKIYINGKNGPLPPLTKDYFQRYIDFAHEQSAQLRAQAAAAKAAAGASSAGVSAAAPSGIVPPPPGTVAATSTAAAAPAARPFPTFRGTFQSCLTRIQKASHTPFAAGAAPEMTRIHQGQIGDCYFLSAIGGMAYRDSGSVQRLIQPLPDGSCDVTFPRGEKVRVRPLTDGEIAVSSTASGTGDWVPILEHAFGGVRVREKGLDGDDTVAIDLIKRGGSTKRTIEFLTGHAATRFALRRSGAKTMPTAEEVASKLADVRAGIASALQEKRLVTASTDKCDDRPPAISPNHAYAVVGYDPEADRVTVWNPHCNSFTPKGEAGLQNGYPTKDGVFTLPLPELARVFSSITWETSDPRPAASGAPAAAPAR